MKYLGILVLLVITFFVGFMVAPEKTDDNEEGLQVKKYRICGIHGFFRLNKCVETDSYKEYQTIAWGDCVKTNYKDGFISFCPYFIEEINN